MLKSLEIEVEQLDDGSYMIDAPWLKAAIHGASFEEVYWKAMEEYHGQRNQSKG